jgi:hypothetical protein
MIDDMGIFRTRIEVAALGANSEAVGLDNVTVVFARPGNMVLLGAHGLEALNLRIDLARTELVLAGPATAAVVAA